VRTRYFFLTPVRDSGTIDKWHNHLWVFKCVCGKEILRPLCRVRAGISRSCGCKSRNFSPDLTGLRLRGLTVLYRVDGGHWLCKCSCGGLVKKRPYELRHGPRTSCRKCYRKWHPTPRGMHHYRYDSTMTTDERQKRKIARILADPLWREAALGALRRDHYTCRSCGSRKRLLVHHVYPWREYEELRYTNANLITLCDICHREIHRHFSFSDADAEETLFWFGQENRDTK